MSKITQVDLYILELDSHDIAILDLAISAYKDAHMGTLDEDLIYPGYRTKLETLHFEISRFRE